MCSPSRSPLQPPTPSHPIGSSQCTSPQHLSLASNLGWWSVSPLIVCLFQCYLTVASWPAYRFLRRQVRWSGIPIPWRIFQFVVIHTVKDFVIVNEAEVDVFLELFCFFSDPTDAGNFISGSFAFSKSSLNIWKFTVPILLKPGLENFEHYFADMWDECNCAVVWAFFDIAFLWDWKENWPFPYIYDIYIYYIIYNTWYNMWYII